MMTRASSSVSVGDNPEAATEEAPLHDIHSVLGGG
jgi:hypothetical protein